MVGTLPNHEGAATAGGFPISFAAAMQGSMMEKSIQTSIWFLRHFNIEGFGDLAEE